MAELLKNRYNYNSLKELALNIKAIYHIFQVDDFINDIMNQTWEKLEIKARMRQIAINLGKYLPSEYEQALDIIDKVIANNYPLEFNDFTLMYFPYFVELYGQNEDHWDSSIAALAIYTLYSSSEFAVRPFIIKNEKRMMQQMLAWSKHDNAHIRRLASEGCRPQLPWAQVLTSFKKDPTPIFVILEQLKTDPSLYVRKSVANNLNDISKHPKLVTQIASSWYGKNNHTNWILKHACRTLFKKGNQDVLHIFGFSNPSCVHINEFTLITKAIYIGTDMTFFFKISTKNPIKIRLEYYIDYVKANNKISRKIFQISEILLKANNQKTYTKNILLPITVKENIILELMASHSL